MIQPLRLEIPEKLETSRLLLRAPSPDDAQVIFKSVRSSISELKEWMPWATDNYALGDSSDWCRRAAARFILREEAAYLIFSRETAGHIGTISSMNLNWAVPKFGIGYWMATSQVGNGYMTEAVAAVIEMTFDAFGARRIEIRADARNQRSRRVAERAGFVLEGILKNDVRAHGDDLRDMCVFAMTR